MAERTNAGVRWAVILIAVVAIVLLNAFGRGRALRGEQPRSLGVLAVATAPSGHLHV